MKFIFFFVITSFFTFQSVAQINIEDSTVQVIGFWDMNESQSYWMSLEKIKLKGADTTSKEIIQYEVDVTIKDSTENSYTIEWFYKNFNISSTNKLTQRLASLAQDIKVLIKTDEMGAVQEVVNWEEVRDYMLGAIQKMKKEMQDIPNLDAVVKQVEGMYSTREAVESSAILDAQQFYTFHGAKYKLGEVIEGKLQVPNLYGSQPFDSDVTIFLDEVNVDESNYIIRSTQTVDSEQLTEATFAYLIELSKTMGVKPPKKEDLKEIKNETLTASRIHNGGWVIYSVQTKTVSSGDITNIEERVMEIK